MEHPTLAQGNCCFVFFAKLDRSELNLEPALGPHEHIHFCLSQEGRSTQHIQKHGLWRFTDGSKLGR